MNKGKYAGAARTPDVGVGYTASYKDKTSGAEVKYLKLYIRPEELAKLSVGTNGMVALTGFINKNKKSEKTPDLVLKPASQSKGSNAKAATSSAAVTTDDLPF